jgi:meso-butanediol dehydrogenase / (S,S)-butanediol dehydrogenase / diacetyl reductase
MILDGAEAVLSPESVDYMKSLAEKVAIVTGGAMGIGGASARRLAACGTKVFVADVDLAAAEANVARIRAAGGVAEAGRYDVSQQDQVEALVADAVSHFGRLDILVNNAYNRHEPDGSVLTLSDSALDYALTIMVKTQVWAVRCAVPHMTHGGAIVNIASVHGFLMAPATLGYETGKAAVIALTKQMAIDLGPKGIRVNAICPGHIVTERMQSRWTDRQDLFGLVEAQYPVGRTGTPDDIAHAVRFLCSDEAAFITGHALVVDGGMTIQLQENFGYAMARYGREHPDLRLPGE